MNKLIHRKGDLVLALKNKEVDYMMHCVNMQGVMGAGIARQIKQEFPNVFTDYSIYCKDEFVKLGDTVLMDNVFSLFAQEFFGKQQRQVHYGALVRCLDKVVHLLRSGKKVTIGVPKLMCCGLAGGNWEVVEEMLQSLPEWITVVIYDFN